MAKRPLPTAELLRQLLDYDADTGILTWRPRRHENLTSAPLSCTEQSCAAWNKRFAGKPAFVGIDGAGYHQGAIFGHYLKAHRVIWVLVHGRWPDGEIDHINGDARDNRLINLRDVPHSVNLRNCRRSKRNTSGITGVVLNKKTGRWVASICINRKIYALGTYDTIGEAAEARLKAQVDMGFAENHGNSTRKKNKYVPKLDRV